MPPTTAPPTPAVNGADGKAAMSPEAAPPAERVEPLTIEELPLCVPFGSMIFDVARRDGVFEPRRFLETWATLYAHGVGQIFAFWQEQIVVGLFGGFVHPDLYDGRLIAKQAFWYVRPEARGTPHSLELLEQFERWAQQAGAVDMDLGASCDERLAATDRLYRKCGYERREVWYRKSLRILHA